MSKENENLSVHVPRWKRFGATDVPVDRTPATIEVDCSVQTEDGNVVLFEKKPAKDVLGSYRVSDFDLTMMVENGIKLEKVNIDVLPLNDPGRINQILSDSSKLEQLARLADQRKVDVVSIVEPSKND